MCIRDRSNGFASKDNPDPDTRAWKQSQITYTDGLKAGDMAVSYTHLDVYKRQGRNSGSPENQDQRYTGSD